MKYLDISAMAIQDEDIRELIEHLANKRIKLHTLQCRKNDITMEGMTHLIQKMHSNQHLNVLNLNDNYILNDIAHELEKYVMNNIFIEDIYL